MEKVMKHIAHNYDFYLDICVKMTKNDRYKAEELLQATIGYIIDKFNKKKLIAAERGGFLKWYLIRILKNQIWSTTSYFYRENHHRINYDIDVDRSEGLAIIDNGHIVFETENSTKEYMKIVNEILKTKKWYQREIFNLYFSNPDATFRSIQKETKISHSTIWKIIREISDEIKQTIDEEIISKETYKCPHCTRQLKNKTQLQMHIVTKHP